MNDLLEKVGVDDGLYIYLQRNSKVWLARFKAGGKWISRTTKQSEKVKVTPYSTGATNKHCLMNGSKSSV